MTTEIAPAAALRAALDTLAERLTAVPFDLPAPEQDRRRALRRDVLWSVREYLVPRLADLTAPAVAVVIGSTGSGKSTIVNTLAQRLVSRPGAVRPTTRHPVVWTHEQNAAAYTTGFLSGSGNGEAMETEIVTGTAPLLEGVTIIDSPDFDSVVEENREMANALLAVADLCVFVTSAQRYADAVPWEFLVRAKARGLPTVFVVNRIPENVRSEVVTDYERRLHEHDLLEGPAGAELLTILEQSVDLTHGGLPSPTVAPLRYRLEDLADTDRRTHLIRAATAGAATDVVVRSDRIRAEAEAERTQAGALAASAEQAFRTQMEEIRTLLADGSLIRAEVVSRWQDFVGTGQLVQVIAESAGAIRRWLARVFGGSTTTELVQKEARTELVDAVVRRADLAATATASAWDLDTTGRALLAESGVALWRHAPETPDRATTAVEKWMTGVAGMVSEEGADRRRLAQVASVGVNAVAVSLMLGAFAHTGGLTGAEVGVAAGAAAAQQKVLEHVFGSAAARSMITRARASLDEQLEGVLHADGARFSELSESRCSTTGDLHDLQAAIAAVEQEAGRFYGA